MMPLQLRKIVKTVKAGVLDKEIIDAHRVGREEKGHIIIEEK